MAKRGGGGDEGCGSTISGFSENRGAFAPTRKYIFTKGSEEFKVIDVNETEKGSSSLTQSLKITLRQVFLPTGFPHSVSKDYVTYQIWDTVQAFASSITGALATEAVMKGVGVGNEAATPLAAALTWLLKSGSGHIGQILFSWAKGTSLDFDCKKWRLFADGLNDIATFIDLIAPLFPTDMIVVVLCSSSVARALVGVAGSATRSAVTHHQARSNNMAEVGAKDGSQETLVNFLALITSLILLPAVSGKIMAVWTLYVIFTCIHLFANYKAVNSLEIETLNRPRLLQCLQEYIKSGSVSSLKLINMKESVILGRGLNDAHVCGQQIQLGETLDVALEESSVRKKSSLERLILQSCSKPFLVIPNSKGKINVILHEYIQPEEILEAYCRAVFLAIVHAKSGVELSSMDGTITKDWENFRRLTENQGFTFNQAPLQSNDWRAKWMHS